MSAATVALALLCAPLLGQDVRLDRPPLDALTDGRFDAALAQPISGSWAGAPLRDVLRAVEAHAHVAIVLDRRVDPSRPVTTDAAGLSLLAFLESIATENGLTVRVVGNVVCIGPPEGLAKLRTLVRLREQEFSELVRQLPSRRQLALAERRTIHWNDLDRPADILRQIADAYHLDIEGLDRVPHDLWAGATLPDARLHESLSLVLNQFDLTFEWADDMNGVRFITAPERVFIEHRYRPRGAPAATALREWTQEIPDLDARIEDNEVVVRGTAEQHDALAALLQPARTARNTPTTTGRQSPTEQRITLKVENVPAAALLQKLEESGFVLEYDARVLADAGVDLNTRVSLDVKKATAEEFFSAFCEPLGLSFEIDGGTVRLSPK